MTMMESLQELIAVMSETDFYPHRPVEVELKQTHISCVFLAGEFVYKVKKAVRFPFLDYSTLDRRHYYCGEEVRLNRRLAPKVYLGVVPIVRENNRFALGDESFSPHDAKAAEFAVMMRRLPEDRMLSRLLVKGAIGEEEIHRVAEKLVSFHRAAATAKAALFGTAEAIGKQVSDNVAETEMFVGQTISAKKFQAIQDYNSGFLASHVDVFNARLREERIREGHGDLRAEHICMAEEIDIFDCVEFNEAFRYGDVCSELAFLAMDLDFLGGGGASHELETAYAAMAGDDALPILLPFYKCYRACVRGKVESLKTKEEEVPDFERKSASLTAQRYFSLAYRYSQRKKRPALLVVCGQVGTGKSTVARMLGDLTGFQVLNSDVVRKELAHIPPTERVRDKYGAGIYTDDFTRVTYLTLLAKAERCLEAGEGVIIDATFKEPECRRLFLHRAGEKGVPVLFIECRAREGEILRRLKQRQEKADEPSDATSEIYHRHRNSFVSLADVPDRFRFQIDTETNLQGALEELEGSL